MQGDTHGSSTWVKFGIYAAKNLGCDKIFQVGDFGFWPHTASGQNFLNNVCTMLKEHDMELDWIDGNHENHDWLAAQDRVDGVWTLGDRLHHHERGHRWEWDGVSFLACGGAYSIDKKYRIEGQSWWAGETITEADVERCGVDPVDVMFTHDAPADAKGAIPDHPGVTIDRQKDRWPESRANRLLLQAIVDQVMPQLLLHGHYHHRNSEVVGGTRIEGLDRDENPNCMVILNLPDLTVERVPFEMMNRIR